MKKSQETVTAVKAAKQAGHSPLATLLVGESTGFFVAGSSYDVAYNISVIVKPYVIPVEWSPEFHKPVDLPRFLSSVAPFPELLTSPMEIIDLMKEA